MATRILHVSAGARYDGSISRALADDLIAALVENDRDTRVTQRDLAGGLPFIDEIWVRANFTPADERDAEHAEALAMSDELVAEVRDADILVIGAPLYNFSIPAVLKAWIDMIARAGLTFRYTENGPEGLLRGKKAYVIVPSGGVPLGSPMDFATAYLRHVLGFVGITDVEFVGAAGADRDDGRALDEARTAIAELVDPVPRAA